MTKVSSDALTRQVTALASDRPRSRVLLVSALVAENPKAYRTRGLPRRRTLRALLVVIILVAAVGAAQAQSLRVVGTAGYVSEWELSGETAQTDVGPIKEFAGPLTLKHVGLCSRDGPQEETGEIRFQILGSGSLAKIKATLLYLGTRCTYTGKLSNSFSHGFMQCSDVNGIPLTLIVSK
jgi:hypothetical protein